MTCTFSPLFRFTAPLRMFSRLPYWQILLQFFNFYWKKLFCISFIALAWWLVLCLPFRNLLHLYFLFIARLRIFFHGCCNENLCNRFIGFYKKKLFYIWCMALAWWLKRCLPFVGLQHNLESVMFSHCKWGYAWHNNACNLLLCRHCCMQVLENIRHLTYQQFDLLLRTWKLVIYLPVNILWQQIKQKFVMICKCVVHS